MHRADAWDGQLPVAPLIRTFADVAHVDDPVALAHVAVLHGIGE